MMTRVRVFAVVLLVGYLVFLALAWPKLIRGATIITVRCDPSHPVLSCLRAQRPDLWPPRPTRPHRPL